MNMIHARVSSPPLKRTKILKKVVSLILILTRAYGKMLHKIHEQKESLSEIYVVNTLNIIATYWNFLEIVISDELWFLSYYHEIKHQSMHWKSSTSR